MDSFRVLLAAAVLAAVASPWLAPVARAAGPDTVVAVVNGSAITLAELTDAHQRLPEQYRQIPLEALYSTLLEQLIRGRLMVVEGRKLGLQADPEVKKRLTAFEDQAIQQVYTQRVIDAQVSDAALRQRYADTIATMPPKEELHARHILVKAEPEAVKIIAELKKGADFGEMARLYSTDGAAANGGDLGYFRRDEMIDTFAAAAFALRNGEFSQAPVETEFGFHIIKAEDRRPAPPPSFDDLKEELRQEMASKVLASHVGALSSTALILRFNADGTPLAPAGAPPVERR